MSPALRANLTKEILIHDTRAERNIPHAYGR